MVLDENEEDSRLCTAHHEAGHAVVATVAGARVEELFLAMDLDHADRFGQTTVVWPRKTSIRPKVATMLAGPVAEMIYRGEPLHPGFVAEWKQDWDQAWEIASQLHPSERLRLQFLEQSTKELYHWMNRDSHWAAVAAVADLLLTHDSVEYDELVTEIGFWIERS